VVEGQIYTHPVEQGIVWYVTKVKGPTAWIYPAPHHAVHVEKFWEEIHGDNATEAVPVKEIENRINRGKWVPGRIVEWKEA